MVALPESVTKNRLKRPLAAKSRWRHIRLAIKPCYLGNHASQIKSYYGTLSGSHCRSFRIRHEKTPEATPKTSYPACNKTSLSRKPCITDKSYYTSLSGSHARSFIMRHEKSREAPSGGGLTITSNTVSNTTSLSRKSCMVAEKLLYGLLSWSIGRLVISMKNSKYSFKKLICL